jgi:hypothetical protein
MVVIVAVAIYGAALGLSMRPGLRAVIVAAASVGAAQYGAIWFSQAFMRSPGVDSVAVIVASYAGSYRDLAPDISVTSLAAAVASVVGGISQSGEQRRRTRRIGVMED